MSTRSTSTETANLARNQIGRSGIQLSEEE